MNSFYLPVNSDTLPRCFFTTYSAVNADSSRTVETDSEKYFTERRSQLLGLRSVGGRLMVHWWNDTVRKKTEALGAKPIPAALCSS